MDFISDVWNKAKRIPRRIVLPEATDPRILKAAEIIARSHLAHPILIGEEEKIESAARAAAADITAAEIINPQKSPHLDEYIKGLIQKRKEKGMSFEEAHRLMTEDYPFFAAMMVDGGEADGFVSGAVNTTANTIRATVYCLGLAPGASLISSFFVMITPQRELGEEGILFFADCAVCPNPNYLQLAEISITTAESFRRLVGREPRVAMLSFSSHGSAHHPDTQKVIQATAVVKKDKPDLLVDGELQVDAALIPTIGQRKAPSSSVAGRANVLIFPDLDAGNIGYKLVERFSGSQAIGPILQGAARPVNDLSRGCSFEDIVNVVAITAVMAK